MPELTSIANILKSEEFWLAGADAQKYLHHQFQDFGYRLATQLGDLEHKSIYMRLAKSEDKAVIDQALGFALDYRDVANKGKLFMWKLQQIRKERKKRRAMQNFDIDFVLKQMGETFDAMASEICSKQKSRLDSERETMLHNFAIACLSLETAGRSKSKRILDVGAGGGVDAKYFCNSGLKVDGTEISRALARAAKAFCPEAKVVANRDLLTSKHKPGAYSGIWLDKFWQLIPLESEEKYLVRLSELLQSGGSVFLTARVNDAAEQKWQELEWKGEPLLSFFKANNLGALESLAEKFGFVVTAKNDVPPHSVALILTKG